MSEIAHLQQQLDNLLACQAVTRLKYRYLNACDNKQPDLVTACFAPGEVDIDFGHIGRFSRREDFVTVFEEMGCHPHIVDMHHAQNPLVEITGTDRASAEVGLHFHSLNTRDKTAFQLAGQYSDDYRRIDGEWLITRSHFRVQWVEMRDFSGDAEVVTYVGNAMPASAE